MGAAKLLQGLAEVLPPERLTVVVNTGDDVVMFGLRVSPDIDITLYTLAGRVNPETGWGIKGDTFTCLSTWDGWVSRLGPSGRSRLGYALIPHSPPPGGPYVVGITEQLRQQFGLGCRILPMSDDPIPTRVETEQGEIHFQEYLVKHRAELPVKGIRFEGIERARPAPGVVEAIGESAAVMICPSNPLISIGPILGVPGVRRALKDTSAAYWLSAR